MKKDKTILFYRELLYIVLKKKGALDKHGKIKSEYVRNPIRYKLV